MEMNAVSTRAAHLGDAESVETLLRSLPGVWQDIWRPDCVVRGIQNADGLAFVAHAAERLIGFICAHDVGFRAYLSEFAVVEDWQGKGVGTLLLGQVEKVLRARACALIVADVFPPARGFYLRNHWGHPSAVLMSRRIPGEEVTQTNQVRSLAND